MRAGLPPTLRYIGLLQFNIGSRDVDAVVAHGFPTVRVARVDEEYYAVERTDGQTRLEAWEVRARYNVRRWLSAYGCEDAEWRDASEFL